jgi:riboflavin synthase
MFTGLVQDLGQVSAIQPTGGVVDLWIRTGLPVDRFELGESIAVNGACLTVVKTDQDRFLAQAAPETLRRTTLGGLKVGDRVHLERALELGARLGGHLVLGHVDGVGKVLTARQDGGAWAMEISLPRELSPFFIEKGSVTIDGVSLTVNSVGADRFGVMLIPETQTRTSLSRRAVGESVNLEADVIGKYVARLYGLRQGPGGALDEAVLRAAGFGSQT